MRPLTPVRIEAAAYRVPIAKPLVASFGVMRDRPAVFVRVVDQDGTEGYGEVFCNWPNVAAEHRARLVDETIGPRLLGRTFAGPAEAYAEIDRGLEVLAIQTGEHGPLAQAHSGIDQALWDIAARKAGVPLYRALGAAAEVRSVPVYASGLGPDGADRLAERKKGEGHRAFKLKVGFGLGRDLANLAALRAAVGDGMRVMLDTNQGHDVETAIEFVRRLEPFDITWLEEPVRADVAWPEWRRIAEATPIRLAAGENIRGREFDAAFAAGVLAVYQPDVCKWGGLTGTLAVGRRAVAEGRWLCPHWLTGGIGLVHSLHLLAAVGGDGLLEVDANPNPLREDIAGHLMAVTEGRVSVPQGPGLGFVPDLAALARHRTWPPAKR